MSRTSSYSTGGVTGRFILGVTVPLPYQTSKGGGIHGFMPQGDLTSDRTYIDYEQPRFTLRQGWNTTYPSQLAASGRRSACTPFRAVNNAGDILSRKNYSCGGSCQTYQSRPNMHGLRTGFGHIQSQCDATAIPAAACNSKWTYSGEDYVRFLKQKAMAKNYSDISSGGDQSSASQSAYRAIRRY